METRKDERRFKTSNPNEAIGMYIAEKVVKTWTEDFIDESTNEVVSIERNELLYDVGKQITPELASRLLFDIQAEEIKEIEVSNQRRCGHKYENFHPWKVTVVASGSKKSYLLKAAGMAKAIEIIDDWMELNHDDMYTICKVESMAGLLMIDHLRKVEENAEEQPEQKGEPEKEKEDSYYSVEVLDVTMNKDDDSVVEKDKRKAVILADDAEIATDIAMAFFHKEAAEDSMADVYKHEITAKSVSPFPLSSIIPKEFYEVYIPKNEQ